MKDKKVVYKMTDDNIIIKRIWHDIKYYMFDNIISNLFFDLIFVVLYP